MLNTLTRVLIVMSLTMAFLPIVSAQCSVKILNEENQSINNSILACGDTLDLGAMGYNSTSYQFDSCNVSYHPLWYNGQIYPIPSITGWDTSVCHYGFGSWFAASASSYKCGGVLDNTPAYWLGLYSPSVFYYLVTQPLDFSCGGKVCFDLKFLDSTFAGPAGAFCGATSTLQNVYDSLGSNSFVVVASMDNVNWDTLYEANFELITSSQNSNLIPISSPLSSNYSGTRHCITIPPQLYSPNLRIRFQYGGCDRASHIGIDNVEIAPSMCNYYYDWMHEPGSPNSSNTTVAPQDTSTYTVYYTNGIDDTCSASVTVNVPQFDIAFTPEIDSVGCNDCIPITVDLPQFNSGSYSNYTFEWSPAMQLDTLQGNQVTACMDSISSTFYLEVTDTVTGCISNDSVTVFINHCGCEYIQHNVTIDSCQTGGVYTLNGELSFYDYPATGNLIINALTNTGNYTDTLFQNFVEDSIYTYTIPNIPQSGGQILITAHFEDEISCSDTLILQAPDLPTYSVIQNGNAYCQGDSVYDILLDVELDQSGTLYYTFNGTNQSVSLTPGQVNLGNQEGVYILNSFVDVNCSQYFGDTITIIIHPLPTVNAGTDTSFCVGNTYTLNATGAQTYQWEGGYADQQVLTPTLGQYQFIVEGTDTNSCTNTDTVNITVNNLPEVSFTADTLEGCEPLEVTFTNITQNTQSLTWNINGSNYNTNTVVHEFNAGLYTISLEVTDQNNCLNDTSYTDYIEVHPNPVADFKASNNLINSLDNSVAFTNQSTGATYYQWSFGDGDSSTLVDPIHSYLGNERIVFQVELLATSTEGCTDRAYQSIELKPELLYYVPNTFTPNGDASNNTFQPVFTSGIDFTSYSLEIYNRGGKLIFETTHANQAWDGTFNGKPVPDGVYTYKIYFTSAANAEREFITGHVNVLR